MQSASGYYWGVFHQVRCRSVLSIALMSIYQSAFMKGYWGLDVIFSWTVSVVGRMCELQCDQMFLHIYCVDWELFTVEFSCVSVCAVRHRSISRLWALIWCLFIYLWFTIDYEWFIRARLSLVHSFYLNEWIICFITSFLLLLNLQFWCTFFSF